MRGPGGAGEQPHQAGDGKAVGGVIRQPDWQEAEHERTRVAPEPQILVQPPERDDQDQPAEPGHADRPPAETEDSGGTSLSHVRTATGKRLIQLASPCACPAAAFASPAEHVQGDPAPMRVPAAMLLLVLALGTGVVREA